MPKTTPAHVPPVILNYALSDAATPHNLNARSMYLVRVVRSDGMPITTPEAQWAISEAMRTTIRLIEGQRWDDSIDQQNQRRARCLQAAQQDESFQAILAKMTLPLD